MPEGTLAHLVNQETFESYRSALGGLNAKNKEVVEQKLSELGIDGRGHVLKAKSSQKGKVDGRGKT